MKPRFSTLVSIVVHTVVIGAAVLWSVIAPDTLPSPRDVLAYTEIMPIKVPNVPAPPRSPSPAGPAVSPNAAPLDEPDRILVETGLENAPSARGPVDAVGVIDGLPGGLPGGSEVVAAPPPPPRQPDKPPVPIPLHSGIQAPRKTVDVSPEYPAIARAARQEGIVILESVIDVDGRVESVRVLKGYPLLNEAAVAAVKQWRFTPALLNNKPVPVVMTVTVMFKLQQ